MFEKISNKNVQKCEHLCSPQKMCKEKRIYEKVKKNKKSKKSKNKIRRETI